MLVATLKCHHNTTKMIVVAPHFLQCTPLDDPFSWSLILVNEFSMKDRVVGLTQVPSLLPSVVQAADDKYKLKQRTNRIQYIFTK